jgi:hypothetical protein
MAHLSRIRWWEWLPGRLWRIVTTVEAADEVPGELPKNAAILVGSRSTPKWLVFDCPCRSGHRVMLNLDRARYPHWRLADSKKLTVAPSVDWNVGDRSCHYYIRGGRILWAHHRRNGDE